MGPFYLSYAYTFSAFKCQRQASQLASLLWRMWVGKNNHLSSLVFEIQGDKESLIANIIHRLANLSREDSRGKKQILPFIYWFTGIGTDCLVNYLQSTSQGKWKYLLSSNSLLEIHFDWTSCHRHQSSSNRMGEVVAGDMSEHMVDKVATKSHLPFWGILLTLVVIIGVVATIFYCCCQRWWRKLRTDKAKSMAGGKVDIRSVQLLGQTYKEKVIILSLSSSSSSSSFFRSSCVLTINEWVLYKANYTPCPLLCPDDI